MTVLMLVIFLIFYVYPKKESCFLIAVFGLVPDGEFLNKPQRHKDTKKDG